MPTLLNYKMMHEDDTTDYEYFAVENETPETEEEQKIEIKKPLDYFEMTKKVFATIYK